jgi:hypothetical protein
MADLPNTGWKNKGGTADRSCKCGSWKQHWLYGTKKDWPGKCFVEGCTNKAEVGAHIHNPNVKGEYIAPFCTSCNAKGTESIFTLKDVSMLFSANQSETCRDPLGAIKEGLAGCKY